MNKVYSAVGHHLVGRALSSQPQTPNNGVATWNYLVFIGDAIIFFPFLLFIGYALGTLYPTLAIVEDPNPPAYEPLSANDSADAALSPEEDDGARARPVTSSLRATHLLLRSLSGWRSAFRGIIAAFSYAFLLNTITQILWSIPLINQSLASLLASLALVQLSAAWVHIVISPPSPQPFYRRLPPLRRTFEATCFPTFFAWLSLAVLEDGLGLFASLIGLPMWDRKNPMATPWTPVDGAKAVAFFGLALAVQLLLVVPTQVLLVRVQASLLPPDEDTIVPFDRSFEGKVEPALVGGKGFVSMRVALASFSRASWVRLYVLYAKVAAVTALAYLAMAAIVIPEIILMVWMHGKDRN
ncbi:hypothetical protein B0T17DRAFT_480475 [Bombardia bombarda]|uniref:Ubiquitin carrier protein n=1 Tax=Bombardia bombarda TaxID=252184 RepID=A0AA39XP65_9PEZI|nr:hypothetical protein B0T17DRAFT_480475 [Bombardia bombarda]